MKKYLFEFSEIYPQYFNLIYLSYFFINFILYFCIIIQIGAMENSELSDLLKFYQNNEFNSNEALQAKIIDTFISKNRHLHHFPNDAIKLVNYIQNHWQGNPPPLKPLQLLRLLTRQPVICKQLTQEFLKKINAMLPQLTGHPLILVQSLALHLRFIQLNHEWITYEMYSHILDILALNHPQVIKIIIEIVKQLTNKQVTKVFEQVWYVGRLLFALERLQPQTKPKIINLIKQLLDFQHFNENFRRISGVNTLMNELRKSQSNQLLKLSLLNCIYHLLLTTKTQVIYDLKLQNLPSLLSLKLKQPLNFKQMIFNLKILTHLMLDNDISSRYIEEGLQDAIALLVRAHPTNSHLIKFEDIQEEEQQQAFQQFRLLLIRLLRYVCSLQKNRKIFKKIFPSQLLGLFFDVGHFVKPLKAYLPILAVFNKLDNSMVLAIEDQIQKVQEQIEKRHGGHKGDTIVGNYNLLEELGQGAFGCVYLAKKGSNQYALKRIKIQDSKKNFDSHFREVKIYKELKHPNIVKFYESFIEDNYLYIVMEVVKGCNLSQLIRNQNEKGAYFDEDVIWKLLIPMVSVLRYLHTEKKIIHRDLNPSNIMVDNKFNIKVADFGLAKNITGNSQISQSFVGTLIYSCPQIVQNQTYTEKADIWSLGCIMYELLTLRPPFAGNNPLLLAKNIVSQQFVSQIPEHYSVELKKFVKLCLIKDEETRPNIKVLMSEIVDKIVLCADQLREKQATLCDQITHLSSKINAGGFNSTTRIYGMSTYGGKPPGTLQNITQQDFLRQTQLVKVDSEILNKIGEDPMSKFIDIVKKLSLIASTQGALKKNFKKFVVDSFYNRVIISDDFKGNEMKNQLHKLINLSKEQVVFLGVKFQLKQNYKKSITYEMLYFYIEELYELIKKG